MMIITFGEPRQVTIMDATRRRAESSAPRYQIYSVPSWADEG